MTDSYHGNLPVSPEERDEMLQKIVDVIAKYKLSTPAALFLGLGKPLAFVGSQLMFLTAPMAGLFVDEKVFENYGHIFSDRENVDRLLDMLEEHDHAVAAAQKSANAAKKSANAAKKDADATKKDKK